MKKGMQFVNQDQFGKISEQLNKIPYNTLFARAVLELKIPGKVYADHKYEPKTILITHSYGMSLLFGDTKNSEFNADLTEYLVNSNGHRCNHEWLQVYPEKWNDKLNEILKDKLIVYTKAVDTYSQEEADLYVEKCKKNHVIQWNRINFVYKKNERIPSIKSEYQMKLIDDNIYDQITGSVIPKYFWKSKEDFRSDGVGYALIHNDEIASIAFSAFKFDRALEIGVETTSNYRGMGLGKQVCRELINYCHTNNYTPIWACRKENAGSYRLAKSLGFEESLILPYYELIK